MKITITAIPPYDGTYDVGETFDDWTNREWATLKRISGVTPLTLMDALVGGDVTVVTAIAIVGLQRGGYQRVNEDALWDANTAASFKLDLGGDEEPADPSPVSEPDTPTTPSGSHSPNGSANPENVPSPTGTPSSVTQGFDHVTSET